MPPPKRKRAPQPRAHRFDTNRLDVGIRRAVELLQLGGIETYESCEGGAGHSYAEPTVAFHGSPADGLRALAICLDYGLPVLSLRRCWTIQEKHEVEGPHWNVVFRSRLPGVKTNDGQLEHARAMAPAPLRERVALLCGEGQWVPGIEGHWAPINQASRTRRSAASRPSRSAGAPA